MNAPAKEFSVKWWPIDKPKPYPGNPRIISEDAVEKVGKLIKEYGWTQPIVVDEHGEILIGHTRRLGGKHVGETHCPVKEIHGLSDAQKIALRIADNRSGEETTWNESLLSLEIGKLKELEFDLSLLTFDDAELKLYDPHEQQAERDRKVGSLKDRFGLAPFSVLNARGGWWQDRKRAWLALGIQSEIGRGENLLAFSDTINEPDPVKRGKKKARMLGQDMLHGEGNFGPEKGLSPQGKKAKAAAKTFGTKGRVGEGSMIDQQFAKKGSKDAAPAGLTTGEIEMEGAPQSGTSIFDPVVCELVYRWFSPPKGVVVDPFAGGSVRGVVAAKLGRIYQGVELRGEQIAANRDQAKKIVKKGKKPEWVEGDSTHIRKLLKGAKADLIFSCPPYADLEVYSDDQRDLSTMPYDKFREAYTKIIAESCALLKDHRFACFVVGDVRDESGCYYNFVSHTIEAFEKAGLRLYNEAILVTAAGSLPIRAGKQFEGSRKLGKTHQNVLVFLKGDSKKATEACGSVEFGEIEGIKGADSEFGEEL